MVVRLVFFMVSNMMHVLCEIAIIIYSLKRYQVIISRFTSSYVAHATLTVNKKGAGTFRLAGVSIYTRVIV
jgi:hypothetical protein